MRFQDLNGSPKVDVAYRDPDGYWIDLNYGWIWQNEVHGIHEDTAAAALREMSDVVRCECDDCVAGIARKRERIRDLEPCPLRSQLIGEVQYWEANK